MKDSAVLRSIVAPTFWLKFAQFVVGCLLSGIVLQTVVASLDEREPASVVVHVMESNVDLTIDGYLYRIEEQRFEPIHKELAAGPHKIEMTRGTELLFEEGFDLKGGEEKVLTAYLSPR